VIHLDRRRPG